MGRPKRVGEAGVIYHVLNRANGRKTIFENQSDYETFDRVLTTAVARYEMRLLSYCIMPNHWHLVVWPREDNDLSKFTGWLTLTHTQRWHSHHHSTGSGHLYQGRFKSFPIQADDHFHTVCRYVERNALKANLVKRAEDWRWSSLYRWLHETSLDRQLLCEWPVPRKREWPDHVNRPITESQFLELQKSLQRGCPFGEDGWSNHKIKQLGLESTIRSRGRPKKGS